MLADASLTCCVQCRTEDRHSKPALPCANRVTRCITAASPSLVSSALWVFALSPTPPAPTQMQPLSCGWLPILFPTPSYPAPVPQKLTPAQPYLQRILSSPEHHQVVAYEVILQVCPSAELC
jgi:hypothetical protein